VPKIIDEAQLAHLAKSLRERAGKTRAAAARELNVSNPSIFQAEEMPQKSLFKLRKKLVETYSTKRVIGPVYLLKDR